MKHTGDAEEAVPFVQVVVSTRHAVPEALGVEASDLVVLTAVVTDDLAPLPLELGEG